MKVLMTADAVGGVWTYALELARTLGRRDVDVAIATMGERLTGEQRREARAAGVEQLFATDLALEWMPEPWRDVEAAGEWLLGVAERVRPDVVHLNGYVHAQLPWETPVVVVGHSCVVSWFAAVRGTRASRDFDRYTREVERGLQSADLVVAPTHAMLEALRRHYRFDTDRAVIANGRTAVAPRSKQPYVLAAGRMWDEGKNVAAVERAAARIPWEVRVVGPGSATGAVSRRALESLLGHASIFCHPARYEPFGLGPLEAAHAGCALVLGDIASLREVWEDAATFVDPDDDEALAAELTELVENRCLRAELAARARVHARRYTPERMADGYLDAYERVLTQELAEAVA